MTCDELRARLHPYVDGELAVSEMAAADAHAAECWECGSLVRRERGFRGLLRRQPRESAPPEFRARLLAQIRRERRRRVLRPLVVGSALTAAAAALVVAVLLPALRREPPLVGELVDKHIAYAQIERPAELASTDPVEIQEWFRRRASLRVIVPDYSPAGIRLIGARLADAQERKAAYLLYEKGRTLLSIFMVSVPSPDPPLRGTRVPYRGHAYVTHEWKGYRTVAWAEGPVLFGLVSMLDYDALLECADRLRLERANQARL